MSIEGKKLKQHIGKVKEALDNIKLDNDGVDRAHSLSSCFRLLIISEISQRGVIASIALGGDSDNGDNNDDEILQQSLISTAGKLLLDENQVKPPLIAGAAVVSAFVAQKTAQFLLVPAAATPASEDQGFLSRRNYEGAFQRAKDVGDTRLLVLLNLATGTEAGVDTGTVEMNKLEAIGLLLMRMALGNNSRAASFSNPDQPPVFKRSLDSCLNANHTLIKLSRKVSILKDKNVEISHFNAGRDNCDDDDDDDYLSYYTQDAIYPLLNLIRIAEAKQNLKRASELNLRIAQCYIGAEAKYEPSYVLSNMGCELHGQINEAYIDDSHKIGTGTGTKEGDGVDKRLKLIEEAKKSLDKVDASNLENDVNLALLYKHLKVRVELSHEEILALVIGNERFVASRNRSGLSGGAGTKASFEESVKSELVTGTLPPSDAEGAALDYDRLSTDVASEILRDEIVLSSNKVGQDLSNAICSVLKKQIDRLLLRSQTIALNFFRKKNRDQVSVVWHSVLDFISPLVLSLGDGDTSSEEELVLVEKIESMAISKRNLMRSASEALMAYVWMVSDCSSPPIACLRLASEFLSDFLKQQRTADQEAMKRLEKAEGKVISTSAKGISKIYLALEAACRSARCHYILARLGSEKNITASDVKLIQTLSEEAIRLVKRENRPTYELQFHAKYGTDFLLMLVCWSGMHCSPWSFCNISQARSIVRYARENIKQSAQEWGRKLTLVERILLDIGEADSECGFLSGGMTLISNKLYLSSLDILTHHESDPVQTLLKSHCVSCLARLELTDTVEGSLCVQSAERVKSGMEHLQQKLKSLPVGHHNFYPWRHFSSLQSSIEYHILLQMQLVAELLLKAERPDECKVFLEDATRDSPQNYDVAFSYASFLLQMALYDTNNRGCDVLQKARKQLMKTAKMNVQKADPFALLGVWYEVESDIKRAVGCYSKALMIDPSHPVAGRGILRLKSSKDVSVLVDKAMNQGIFQNGWAWKSLGDSKAFAEGDDERAALCYQQALRARDVGSPKQHRLHAFFSFPFGDTQSELKECGGVWASLGLCYRRLGKHSASVRAFQSASDIFPSDLSYFCAWAQVELELGLIDESVEKFQKVLNTDRVLTHHSAAYGLASCMLVFARQANEQGKFGDALVCLRKGIQSLSIFIENDVDFCCVWKLLGDFYSHGSIIPSSVFDTDAGNGITKKLEFISQGQDIYMRIISSIDKIDATNRTDEMSSLRTAALNDVAINLYLRARLRRELLHEGSGIGPTSRSDIANDEECQHLLNLSMDFFMSAIETDPLLSLSWCGLGTTLVSRDPILAQHAFCRALQLDKGTEDAWANLSLLYFDYDKLSQSEEAVDSLTQVADSAIMWIARGLLIEKQSRSSETSESVISKASDAYRASLQISRHEDALLGLSMTSRRLGVNNKVVSEDYMKEAENIAIKDSHANMEMYMGSTNRCNLGAMALNGIMSCERSLTSRGKMSLSSEQVTHFLNIGRNELKDTMKKVVQLPDNRAPNAIDSAVEITHSINMDAYVPPICLAEDFNKLLTSCLNVSEDAVKSISSKHYVSTARKLLSINEARRNIIQNPGNGLMWLDFSKTLLRALPSDIPHGMSTVVKTSVQKAKEIMISDAVDAPLLHPMVKGSSTHHKSVHSTPVTSRYLSEVFALSDWVKDISTEECCEVNDLQRSILLDPENIFARSKIV